MTANYQAFERDVQQVNEMKSGLISVWFSLAKNGKVTLEAIWSEQERGRGHATKAMRAVLEIADTYDIDIYGQPHALRYDTELHEKSGMFSADQIDLWDSLNENCLSNEALLDWYIRLGFELTGDIFGDDPEIVRRAHAPEPKLGM